MYTVKSNLIKVFILNLRTKEIRGSQIVSFLCYILRPNTSRYICKPMGELPAIESFGKTLDLKGNAGVIKAGRHSTVCFY